MPKYRSRVGGLGEVKAGAGGEAAAGYIARCRGDFGFFCKHEAWIADVNADKVRLELNDPQKEMEQLAAERRDDGLPLLLVVLKSRQWGCSTWIVAWNAREMALEPGTKVLVVAHRADATESFRAMYRLLLGGLSPTLGVTVEVDRGDAIELSNGSRVEFHTAGSKATAKGTGRSKTFQIGHFSEIPFWADPQETFRAAKSTLHVKGRHVRDVWKRAIFLESSPNGRDPVFFQAYQDAKSGKSDFSAFFVPWHAVEWYRMEATAEQEMLFGQYVSKQVGTAAFAALTGRPDEDDRIGKYGLDCGQWLWWNWKLDSEFGGDVEKMRTEYPDDDVTCFAASTGSVFGDKYLAKHSKHQRSGERGKLVEVNGNKEFEQDRFGPHEVWHVPRKGSHYLLTVDVAGGGAESKDWTVATVWERLPAGGGIVQCATHRSQLTPEDAGDFVQELGQWYVNPDGSDALLAIEVNNGWGAAMQAYLRRRGYANFYRRQVQEQLVGAGGLVTDNLGWWTTAKTRSHMVSSARQYLWRMWCRIHDPVLFGELATFVRERKPGTGRTVEAASVGKNDDTVIVMCMACYIDQELAPVQVQVHKAKRPELPVDGSGKALPSVLFDMADFAPATPHNPLAYLTSTTGRWWQR